MTWNNIENPSPKCNGCYNMATLKDAFDELEKKAEEKLGGVADDVKSWLKSHEHPPPAPPSPPTEA
jgi:hypothetical protein